MNNREDLESRLRSYLSTGAQTQPPSGMEARIAARVFRRGHPWVFQLAAAAAVIIIAVGLGIGLNKARQLNGLVVKGTPNPSPVISPSASASPSVKPSASPTSEPNGGPYPLLQPAAFKIVTATTGWAAGSGTDRVLRTSDGGAHWNDVTPSGARLGFWITFFLDANDAWLASSLQPGSPTSDFAVEIYRTSDGGHTWQHVGTTMADQGWPVALDFVDTSHGWLFMGLGGAAGSDGAAFYGTADGGATWTKLSEADSSGTLGHLPLSCSKATPVFLNVSTGWVPGGCSAGGGAFLYVTRDGGRTWNDAGITLPPGFAASCMCEIDSLRFSDSRNGVFVLNIYQDNGAVTNVLYTTSDAGASWRPGPVLPINSYTAFFLDVTHGWTLNGKANSLLSTADGGQHWSAIGSVPSSQGPVDLQFMTTKTGWAMGSEPSGRTILKTVDGGATWTSE